MGFRSKLKTFWNQQIPICEDKKIFVMNRQTVTRYQHRHNRELVCSRCRQPILVGQTVRKLTRRQKIPICKKRLLTWLVSWRSYSWTDYFHLNCWHEFLAFFSRSMEQAREAQDPRVFVMTPSVLGYYRRKHGYEAMCPKCSQPIEIGQVVKAKTKYNTGGSHFWYYHTQCWEALLH